MSDAYTQHARDTIRRIDDAARLSGSTEPTSTEDLVERMEARNKFVGSTSTFSTVRTENNNQSTYVASLLPLMQANPGQDPLVRAAAKWALEALKNEEAASVSRPFDRQSVVLTCRTRLPPAVDRPMAGRPEDECMTHALPFVHRTKYLEDDASCEVVYIHF